MAEVEDRAVNEIAVTVEGIESALLLDPYWRRADRPSLREAAEGILVTARQNGWDRLYSHVGCRNRGCYGGWPDTCRYAP